MNYAIILAAGKSERFNNKNKNLVVINKKPIYKLVLKTFIATKLFKQIILVVNKKDKHLYNISHFPDVKLTIGSNINRQLSITNALKTIKPNTNDIIVTHDCARPFVKQQTIKDNLNCCKRNGFATTMIPLADSICVNNNCEFRYKNRKNLFLVQTPQSFQYKYWKRNKNNNSTDLFTFLKLPIKSKNIVKGSASNFKITYKEDC